MEPTDEHASLALTDDQIERLTAAVLDQSELSVTRTELTEIVLILLEDGLEGIP